MGEVEPCIKGEYTFANLRNVLPSYVTDSVVEGVHGFSRFIHDFDRKDAVLSGVESRTSSPVRIIRNDELVSTSVCGLYPCGEGAGYAGGITSAAVDGVKVAEYMAVTAACRWFLPFPAEMAGRRSFPKHKSEWFCGHNQYRNCSVSVY